MTPEQLAAQFDAYATEGFDAPPGSAIASIADVWSCAARLVRAKLTPTGEHAKALAAECDRLKAELSKVTNDRDYKRQTATDALRLSKNAIDASDAKSEGIEKLLQDVATEAERIASRDETIKHLRYSLSLSELSNQVLRRMIDTLTAENTKLKANQCPSWAVDAKRVSDAKRNMGGG